MLCFRVLTDYLHLLEDWKVRYAPKTPDDALDDRFVEACKSIPIVQNLLDELQDRDADFQKHALNILLEKENWKKLQSYLKQQKKEADACAS